MRLHSLSLETCLTLLQDLYTLFVDFDSLVCLQLIFCIALSLHSILLCFLLSKELLLVSDESLDVTRFILFVVLIDLVAISDTACLITSSCLAADSALVTDLLLAIDARRKTTFLKLLTSLLFLCFSDLGFLSRPLLLDLALARSDVDLDLIIFIIFVHDHVIVRDQQVGALLVVELLYELVVSVVEVLGTLHYVILHISKLLTVRDGSGTL